MRLTNQQLADAIEDSLTGDGDAFFQTTPRIVAIGGTIDLDLLNDRIADAIDAGLVGCRLPEHQPRAAELGAGLAVGGAKQTDARAA